MKRPLTCWMLVIAIIAVWPAWTKAQSVVGAPSASAYGVNPVTVPEAKAPNPAGGTITGNGGATIRPKVESFRMQIQLAARGKTLDEALDRLKARREAALEKLSKLGIEKEGIEIGKIGMTTWSGPVAYSVECAPVAVPPSGSYAAPATNYGGAPPLLSSSGPSPVEEADRPAPATPFVPVNPGTVPANPPASSVSVPPIAPPSEGGWNSAPSVPPSAAPMLPTPSPYASPGPVAYPSYPSTSPNYGIQTYYTVTSSLTADWKLLGESQEDVLRESQRLKEKVEAADLLGLKGDKKLPAEEESLRASLMSYSVPMVVAAPCGVSYSPPATPVMTDESSQPIAPVNYPQPTVYQPVYQPVYRVGPSAIDSTPKFLFVARVTDAQRKAALAEAFAEAKSHAAELAEASGSSLGPIQTVRSTVIPPPFLSTPSPIYYTTEQTTSPVQGMASLAEGKGHENEIQSYNDTDLFQLIQVIAVFRLQ
jgi:uncharacterized protein YggE